MYFMKIRLQFQCLNSKCVIQFYVIFYLSIIKLSSNKIRAVLIKSPMDLFICKTQNFMGIYLITKLKILLIYKNSYKDKIVKKIRIGKILM